MKQLLIILLIAGVLLTLTADAALADGSGNNCAGVASSTGATALGAGFGQIVAVLAAPPLQVVDNLGLADCGALPRQNP